MPDYDPNAFENRDDFFDDDDDVGCPWDIKYCPSGASVSRSGPHCAFQACPEDNDDDDESHYDPCECRDSCEYVNDYHICYVRDPHACHDAFPSRYYEGEKWIHCPYEDHDHPNDEEDHDHDHHDPCKCRDSCEYVNDYHICYVRDPHACHDAFPSRYYDDEKWIWCPWEEEHHHESDWKPPSK